MFSNGKTAKNVRTVAEAIKELSLLPPDMPLDQDYSSGAGADIVVFNQKQDDVHVSFQAGGEWDEDFLYDS